jgi:hypothetical protein
VLGISSGGFSLKSSCIICITSILWLSGPNGSDQEACEYNSHDVEPA